MAIKTDIRGYYPSVVIGKEGVTHWAYEYEYKIWYMRMDAAGNFTKPRKVSANLPYAEVPTISLRGTNLIIAFQTYDKPKQEYSLCHAISTDVGVTWT